jgi:hypothetical protein
VGVEVGSAVAGSVATAVKVAVGPSTVTNGVGCEDLEFRTSTLKVQPEIKKRIAIRLVVSFFIDTSRNIVHCLYSHSSCGRTEMMCALSGWQLTV